MAEQESLFERLGGAPAINAAVDAFYKKVLADDRVNYFFTDLNVDMERQHKMQKAFLTMAFGGPNEYTGRDMRKAHIRTQNMGTTDEHFDIIIEHLANTLSELGVSAELINEVAAVAETTRADVLGK